MKRKIQSLLVGIMIVLMALAFMNCEEDDPEPEIPKARPGTLVNLPFGSGLKVTIKSQDSFLDAEWNAEVNKIISALGTVYGLSNMSKMIMDELLVDGANIILAKDAADDYSLAAGSRDLYVKIVPVYNTSKLGTALMYMLDGEPY
jgi:hypothetical protein